MITMLSTYFCKYVKQLCKDTIGVPTLKHNNQVTTEPKEKANVLNKHFDYIFTDEDLSNIPKCDDNIYGSALPINFTVNGIQNQLNVLDINTASGPDNISGCIFQICATEIVPILTVLFSQSLNTFGLTGCKCYSGL